MGARDQRRFSLRWDFEHRPVDIAPPEPRWWNGAAAEVLACGLKPASSIRCRSAQGTKKAQRCDGEPIWSRQYRYAQFASVEANQVGTFEIPLMLTAQPRFDRRAFAAARVDLVDIRDPSIVLATDRETHAGLLFRVHPGEIERRRNEPSRPGLASHG